MECSSRHIVVILEPSTPKTDENKAGTLAAVWSTLGCYSLDMAIQQCVTIKYPYELCHKCLICDFNDRDRDSRDLNALQ